MIDYKKTSFEDRVHDVDVVFDTVGGKMLERSWQVLRKGGKLVCVASQDVPTTFDNFRYISKKKETRMALMQRVCSSQQGSTYQDWRSD